MRMLHGLPDAYDIWILKPSISVIDSQPVHNERQIVKVVGPVLEKKERYDLPPDIDQHGFSKFSNIYFKVNIRL